MKRTKLRFLFTLVWVYNIFIQFSLLFNILPKTDGQLSLRWLSVVSLLFLFTIYLTGDVFIYRRRVFLKIIAGCFTLFSLVYILVIFSSLTTSALIYLLFFIPTLLSAIYIARDIWLTR